MSRTQFTRRVLLAAIVWLALLMPAAGGGEEHAAVASTELNPSSTPIQIIQGRVFTRIGLNGNDAAIFMIDNGCLHTLVDQSLLDKTEYTPLFAVQRSSLDERDATSMLCQVNSMEIGDMVIYQPHVRISPVPNRLAEITRRKIAGIFGCDVMSYFLTTIDFENGRMHFLQHSPAAVAAIEGLEGCVRIPFGENPFGMSTSHLFSIQVRMGDNIIPAIIDLGYCGGLLCNDPALPDRLNKSLIRVPTTPVCVAGYKGKGFALGTHAVSIGTTLETKTPVMYFKAGAAPVFALLGVKFLERFLLTFDYKNRCVYMAPREASRAWKRRQNKSDVFVIAVN